MLDRSRPGDRMPLCRLVWRRPPGSLRAVSRSDRHFFSACSRIAPSRSKVFLDGGSIVRLPRSHKSARSRWRIAQAPSGLLRRLQFIEKFLDGFRRDAHTVFIGTLTIGDEKDQLRVYCTAAKKNGNARRRPRSSSATIPSLSSDTAQNSPCSPLRRLVLIGIRRLRAHKFH